MPIKSDRTQITAQAIELNVTETLRITITVRQPIGSRSQKRFLPTHGIPVVAIPSIIRSESNL